MQLEKVKKMRISRLMRRRNHLIKSLIQLSLGKNMHKHSMGRITSEKNDGVDSAGLCMCVSEVENI